MVPLAAEKGVGLSVMNRGSIKVMTDPDRLDSILQNLLANALRYTENGTVTVDFGKDSSRFFLEVSDTGVGIPDEIQKDIFRRFYRGEGSTGIGLGLSIVKELLDSMGGTIEIESSEGKGARFRIWLPVRSRQ
jgi:signal transduction histidine kinase